MGLARLIWRGEIHDVDLGQPIGHEPAFQRSGLVVSTDLLNNGTGGLVAVVPITSASYNLRSHVELQPGDNGLDRVSFARCDQICVVSGQRLTRRRGNIAADEMHAVEQALRFVLEL